jgi:hypothetical protein
MNERKIIKIVAKIVKKLSGGEEEELVAPGNILGKNFLGKSYDPLVNGYRTDFCLRPTTKDFIENVSNDTRPTHISDMNDAMNNDMNDMI